MDKQIYWSRNNSEDEHLYSEKELLASEKRHKKTTGAKLGNTGESSLGLDSFAPVVKGLSKTGTMEEFIGNELQRGQINHRPGEKGLQLSVTQPMIQKRKPEFK